MSVPNASQTASSIGATPPSTLVDPFAHYADRLKINLRTDARLFSNSEVQTFKRCRRKWYLAWYRGLRARRERPVGPRAIGDRIHRALAYHYVEDSGLRIDARDALKRLIEEDIAAVLVAHTDLEDEARAELVKQLNKDADVERAMIEGYLQWIEETGEDANIIVLGAEMYKEAPLSHLTGRGGVPVYIIAKMDARVRRVTDAVILYIDHKTVADFAQKTLTLKMDEQMLWYDIIETITGVPLGERSGGALFNMLRRVKRTSTAKPPFYMRLEVRHNRHEIESMWIRMNGMIKDILRTEQLLDAGRSHLEIAYPTPSPTCTWDCDYFSICPLFDDGSRVEAMIETYFVVGNPLAYYER